MILDATSKKLTIVLDAAKTTNDMPVIVDYVDMTTTTTVAGNTDSATNGTTVTDILAAPAASTQRKVNAIEVYNADTASKVVTIAYVNNATSRILVSTTLDTGDTLGYTDVRGWYVQNNTGNFKTSSAISGVVGITNGGTGQVTKTLAFDALSPTTTQGDLIYNNGTNNVRLAKGTGLQQLRMNAGATAPEWATVSSSITWTIKTASFNVATTEAYEIDSATAAATITATLPATPSANDFAYFADYSGVLSTYNLVVARNGNKIMGLSEDMTVNINNVAFRLTYIDATQGWRLT